MQPNTAKLFWDIITCPLQSNSKLKCKSILSTQCALDFKIPEPWNGDIDNAEVMIIGYNPALDPLEVYPSYNIQTQKWNLICSNNASLSWNHNSVEDFFENRFNAKCICGQKKYVKFSNTYTISQVLNNSCQYKNSQNPYWKTTIKYASAVCGKPLSIDDIVYTDAIHCKSSSSEGCPPAVFNECVDKYLKRIIDIFINNNNKNPKYILLIGTNLNVSTLAAKLNLPIINTSIIGNYTHTRVKIPTQKDIQQHNLAGNVVLISPLPLPSGANNACRNITINGTVINWNKRP